MTTDEMARLVVEKPLCRCNKPGCRFHAADAVCRAWLAENDKTPVSEEWLLWLGFSLPRDNPHCPFIFSGWGADRYCIAYEPTKCVFSLDIHTPSDGMSSYMLPDMETRGDVLRLMRTLGIKVAGASQ